jgi:hypothetical protein
MSGLRKSNSLFSTVANSFGTGEAVTITPNSVVGLPTGNFVLTFDRLASDGVTKTPTKMERIMGAVSGSNFVVASGGRGYDKSTEQAHTSPVTEVIWNAKDWNDAVDALTNVVSATTGALDTTKVVDLATAQALTNKTLTSPVINGTITGTAGFLSSKIITDTRDMTAVGAPTDVAYTGVGFKPTSLMCTFNIDGTQFMGIGFVDSALTNAQVDRDFDSNFYTNTNLINLVITSNTGQRGLLKSFDADGFTITWTKVGSPTGTGLLRFLCFR